MFADILLIFVCRYFDHKGGAGLKRRKKIDLFELFNGFGMAVLCFIIIYPLWFCLVFSLNDGNDTAVNGILYWWPRVFTLTNYQVLFQNNAISTAFFISILRTLVGTCLHLFLTSMVAYAFTKKELPFRNFGLTLGTISLFFGGGLIPTYLWYRNINLLDTFWVLILPMAFNFYNALIFMGFFRNLPDSIEESAYIDGAHEFTIFIKLILPLSTPVIATIAIFNGVAHWNDYFSGFIFIRRNDFLVPIQTFLYQMVATNEAYSKIPELSRPASQVRVTPDSVRVATMLVTTAPIMVVYPFLQKYFTKGVMLGAIKG